MSELSNRIDATNPGTEAGETTSALAVSAAGTAPSPRRHRTYRAPCALGHGVLVPGEHQPSCKHVAAEDPECAGCWPSAPQADGSDLCLRHLVRVMTVLSYAPFTIPALFQLRDGAPVATTYSEAPRSSSAPKSRPPAHLEVLDAIQWVLQSTVARAHVHGWLLAPTFLLREVPTRLSVDDATMAVSASCDWLLDHLSAVTSGESVRFFAEAFFDSETSGGRSLEQIVASTEVHATVTPARRACPREECDRMGVLKFPPRGPGDSGVWHCPACGWSSSWSTGDWATYFG